MCRIIDTADMPPIETDNLRKTITEALELAMSEASRPKDEARYKAAWLVFKAEQGELPFWEKLP